MKLTKEYIAIAAICWLETIALLQGINGVILSLVIATIAGLAGFGAGKITANRRLWS